MKRWYPIFGGMSLNLAFGSLYAWSIFVLPLEKEFGWRRAETAWVYTIAIIFTVTATVIGGRLQDRHGPRVSAVIGGTLLLDWTIDGASDPNQCNQSSAADIDVIVTGTDGSSVGEFKQSCSAFATSIDLAPGRYNANAVLLDSSGAERTTEVPIHSFLVSSDTETSIPIDFPSDSFH